MKFNIGDNINFEFTKDDAKIAIPLILYVLLLIYSIWDRRFVSSAVILYYLIYFIWERLVKNLISLYKWITFRCPKCRSKQIILQGYQTYRSDEHYPYYLCLKCNTTSIGTLHGLHYQQLNDERKDK